MPPFASPSRGPRQPPTDAHRGLKTTTSEYGSLEEAVNPLLYVLAYGCNFVAQGTPADLPGLASLIEEAIRFPGFSFVNVQSPCVTYGEDDQQIKAQKAKLKTLQSLGHDPSDRIRAMDLAQHYGRDLYTGVFYRTPAPPKTFEALVRERQQELAPGALPRARILERFQEDPAPAVES